MVAKFEPAYARVPMVVPAETGFGKGATTLSATLPRVEISVLFVDLVGSTELGNRLGADMNDEIRRDVFAAMRRPLSTFAGLEVKGQGDGLMAVFFAANDAFGAALAMLKGVQRLSLRDSSISLAIRIGLSCGDAIHEDNDYFGTCVVEAARLCSAAGSGEIYVTDTMVASVPHRRRITPVGALSLKGFPDLVPTSQLLEEPSSNGTETVNVLPAHFTADGEPTLVGRDRDIAAFAAMLDAVEGGTRRDVVISADAGIGATRMLSAVADMAATRGFVVFAGDADGADYGLWASSIRWWALGVEPAELRACLGGHAEVLVAAVPVIGTRLGIAPAALVTQAEISAAVLHLLGAFVAPVLVVLDDLSRADDLSLAVLYDILASPSAPRLAIVGAARLIADGRVSKSLETVLERVALAPSSRFQLQPLDDAAVVRLAADTLAIDAQAIGEFIAGQSGGSPRIAGDILRRLRSDGLLTRPVDVKWRDEAQLAVAAASPYRGLLTFDIDDAEVFFGRETLVDEVLNRFDAGAALLTLVGASGSGKSSLARAGVLAKYRDSGRSTAVCALGGDALQNLSAAVERLGPSGGCLLVDQLEEIFTREMPSEARRAFLHKLVEITTADDDIVLLVTIRGDFYGRIAEYEEFADLVERGTLLVGSMNETELRSVMTGPAAAGGLRFEPGLVETILADVREQPGALPLLSHALHETWRRRNGNVLGAAGYHEAGGARGAIAQTADAVYTFGLDSDAQRTARSLLMRLVTVGEGSDDTRRAAPLEELPKGADVVLTKLAAARLVTIDGNIVELAHEALIREWPRLRTWIDDDRDAARTLQHLTGAAREWNAHDRDESMLYRGARLGAADELTASRSDELNPAEREFVVVSRALAQREQAQLIRRTRRLRRMLVGVAAMLLVSLVAGGLALQQRSQATRSARTARSQANEADLQRLVATAQNLASSKRDLGMLLAAAAYKREPRSDTEGALFAALAVDPNFVRYVRFRDGVGGSSDRSDSPDLARRNVLALRNERVDFVDLQTGASSRSLDLHRCCVGRVKGAVAFDARAVLADTALLVAAGTDRPVFDNMGLWIVNARNGAPIRVLRTGSPLAAWFVSADGALVAAISEGPVAPEAVVWDIATGKILVRILLPTEVDRFDSEARTTLAWSSRQDLAVGSTDGLVYLWSPKRPASVKVMNAGEKQRTAKFSIGFGASGSWLVTESLDKSNRQGASVFSKYDVATGERLWVSVDGGLGQVLVVGDQIFTTYYGGVERRSSRDGSIVDRFATHTGSPCERFASTDAKTLYIRSCNEATIAAFSIDGHNLVARPIAGAGMATSGGNFSPNAKYLLTRDGLGALFSVDLTTGKQTSLAMIAAIPLDDHLVGGVTGLTKLGIADLDHGGKVTQSLSTQGGAATNLSSAVASPNRLALALGDVDGTVTVISRSNPGILWKYRRQGASYRVNGLVYSDDSSRLLVSYQDETGSLLDAKNGRLLHTFAKGATSAFSHDGRLIAMSAYNGRITFNDSKNFKPVGAPLSGGSAFLASLRFSADGKWLIAVDSENKLLIFDVATRREIGLPIRSATGGNGQIAIANDGGMVAITTDQGIALWPLDPNSWAKAVCSAAARNLTRAEWTTYVGGPYQIVCPEWPAGA